MPIKVHAAYDPITAAECEVADGFDPKTPLVAGASTQLVIQVRFFSCMRASSAFLCSVNVQQRTVLCVGVNNM